MTHAQRIFDLIAASPDEPIAYQQIETRVYAGVGSIEKTLSWLCDHGYIERCPHPTDGRRWLYRVRPGAQRPIDGRQGNGRVSRQIKRIA